MNVIIPMAGIGSRLRPITPITPKPLISLVGKTIIYRIIAELYQYTDIKKIGFILQQKNNDIENNLKQIVFKKFDKKIDITFFYQTNAKGTAHAIYCAKKLLKGKVLIIFSDTLFFLKKAINFQDLDKLDGAIFVKKVEDPSSYGVVKKNKLGLIVDFVEKPNTLISKLAMIGVYYFKESENLENEIKKIIKNNITEKNEFQLTTALKNLMNNNKKFTTIEVKDWLDCGTHDNLIATSTYLMSQQIKHKEINFQHKLINVEIGKNCIIKNNVVIKNSTVGPNVSIENNSVIENSSIDNSILQQKVTLINATISNSIIGKCAEYNGKSKSIIIGPYSNLNRA